MRLSPEEILIIVELMNKTVRKILLSSASILWKEGMAMCQQEKLQRLGDSERDGICSRRVSGTSSFLDNLTFDWSSSQSDVLFAVEFRSTTAMTQKRQLKQLLDLLSSV